MLDGKMIEFNGWTFRWMNVVEAVRACAPPPPTLNFTKCPLTNRLLSGGGQKTLTEKVSLPFSDRPSRNEAFTPFIAERRLFQARGGEGRGFPTGKVSDQFLT